MRMATGNESAAGEVRDTSVRPIGAVDQTECGDEPDQGDPGPRHHDERHLSTPISLASVIHLDRRRAIAIQITAPPRHARRRAAARSPPPWCSRAQPIRTRPSRERPRRPGRRGTGHAGPRIKGDACGHGGRLVREEKLRVAVRGHDLPVPTVELQQADQPTPDLPGSSNASLGVVEACPGCPSSCAARRRRRSRRRA